MNPLPTFTNLPAEKQEFILKTALHEFSENGYTGTSINSVIRKLGIAKGSIYQYFGDKKGLFLYVFTASTEHVKSYLREVRDSTTRESLSIRLEKTLTAGIEFIRDHPVIYRLYIKILVERETPFRDEILTALRGYSFEYVRDLLSDADAHGELKPETDIEASSFIIDAVMDKFLQERAVSSNSGIREIFEADETETQRWVIRIVSTLCRGLVK